MQSFSLLSSPIVWDYKTSLTPPRFIEEHAQGQKSERSCICVVEVSDLPLILRVFHWTCWDIVVILVLHFMANKAEIFSTLVMSMQHSLKHKAQRKRQNNTFCTMKQIIHIYIRYKKSFVARVGKVDDI